MRVLNLRIIHTQKTILLIKSFQTKIFELNSSIKQTLNLHLFESKNSISNTPLSKNTCEKQILPLIIEINAAMKHYKL